MAALSLVIAACGGDDGNGGGGPPDNEDPVADFSFSCEALACTFTDESTDPNGNDDITGWSWDFGDDATSTEPSPSHSYAAASTYTVTLTVTDDDGATGTVSHDVTVTAPATNQAPTASFTSAADGLQVAVDGTGSSDPDGSVASHAWAFGDGSAGTGGSSSPPGSPSLSATASLAESR